VILVAALAAGAYMAYQHYSASQQEVKIQKICMQGGVKVSC